MAKKHSFAKGVATGLLGTAATVAGAVFAVKKTIIEPEKRKLAFIEENRKKAAALVRNHAQNKILLFAAHTKEDAALLGAEILCPFDSYCSV